ncbi:MAG: CDP-glycerol glycerophosphotransferase family protein [Selenomonadaceae bacterium]|nr:CDP-glycerol glycerophosphotransferase family protein [Selenomonadaceae bacterium]
MYNVEKYIVPCVQSVLNQTMQDFEIILIDDNSTDHTIEVCNNFFSNNDKIKIIRHNENKGVGVSRNAGIDAAKGKFVYFLDSDDFILPNALEILYKAAVENDAEIVHSSYWYEIQNEDLQAGRMDKVKICHDKVPQPGFLSDDLVQNLIKQAEGNNCPAGMVVLNLYERDFLNKNKLKFAPMYAMEDVAFHFLQVAFAKRYLKIPQAFYIYRRRPGSTTCPDPKNSKPQEEINKIVKDIQTYIIAVNYLNSNMKRLPILLENKMLREYFLKLFFNNIHRFSTNYENFKDKFAVIDTAMERAFEPFFGENTNFVKFLFHDFNVESLQKNKLFEENQELKKILSNMNQIFENEKIKIFEDTRKIFNEHFSVEPQKIVFYSFSGGYSCNPKYIAKEILRQKLPYDLVWIVKDVNDNVPNEIRKVKYESNDMIYELATAKVIITNTKLDPPLIKKSDQYLIMTWHGSLDLKRVEADAENSLPPDYVKASKNNSKMIDLMLADSRFQFNKIPQVYWYDGEILKSGLPRNDILFDHSEKFVKEIKNSLKIPLKNKVIMYAPTFRSGNLENFLNVCKIDFNHLIEVLERKFNTEVTLLIRLHPHLSRQGVSKFLYEPSEKIIDVTTYIDPQELWLVSDMLISDYSSVIADFTIQRKPVFIYAKDLDTYDRGMNDVYFKLPFKITRTEEDLIKSIENFDDTELKEQIDKFLTEIGFYDQNLGHSSEKVVDVIKNVIDSKK